MPPATPKSKHAPKALFSDSDSSPESIQSVSSRMSSKIRSRAAAKRSSNNPAFASPKGRRKSPKKKSPKQSKSGAPSTTLSPLKEASPSESEQSKISPSSPSIERLTCDSASEDVVSPTRNPTQISPRRTYKDAALGLSPSVPAACVSISDGLDPAPVPVVEPPQLSAPVPTDSTCGALMPSQQASHGSSTLPPSPCCFLCADSPLFSSSQELHDHLFLSHFNKELWITVTEEQQAFASSLRFCSRCKSVCLNDAFLTEHEYSCGEWHTVSHSRKGKAGSEKKSKSPIPPPPPLCIPCSPLPTPRPTTPPRTPAGSEVAFTPPAHSSPAAPLSHPFAPSEDCPVTPLPPSPLSTPTSASSVPAKPDSLAPAKPNLAPGFVLPPSEHSDTPAPCTTSAPLSPSAPALKGKSFYIECEYCWPDSKIGFCSRGQYTDHLNGAHSEEYQRIPRCQAAVIRNGLIRFCEHCAKICMDVQYLANHCKSCRQNPEASSTSKANKRKPSKSSSTSSSILQSFFRKGKTKKAPLFAPRADASVAARKLAAAKTRPLPSERADHSKAPVSCSSNWCPSPPPSPVLQTSNAAPSHTSAAPVGPPTPTPTRHHRFTHTAPTRSSRPQKQKRAPRKDQFPLDPTALFATAESSDTFITSLGFSSYNDCSTRLQESFTHGLFVHHHTWREPLATSTTSLLDALIHAEDVQEQRWASLALHVLPGLLRVLSLLRSPTPIGLLDAAAAEKGQHAAIRILRVATALLPYIDELRAKAAARPMNAGPTSRQGAKAKLRRRILKLFEDNRIGSAVRVLDEAHAFLESDETQLRSAPLDMETAREVVGSLNPPAGAGDELPPLDDAEAIAAENRDLPLEISADVVREVLKNLPQGSACGASGWTFASIRFAFQERDTLHEERITVLRAFCAAFLAGRLCPDHLLRSRAVLIPKDDSKYRPLGIGESWYRFGARVASALLAHSVGKKLAPLQLGCGISSGCELAYGLAATWNTSSECVLVKTDFKNAFNLVPRRAIYDGLVKFCPQLLRWFRWAYGDSRPLVDHIGREVGRSCTGCRQGDPLAPLLFCVAMQPALLRLHEEMRCANEFAPYIRNPLLVGFMDDVTMTVHHSQVRRICDQLRRIFEEEVGLRLNEQKCSIVLPDSPSVELLSAFPADEELPFPVVREGGCIVLGCPIGSEEYILHQFEIILAEASQSLPALHMLDLPPAVQFKLLKMSINARVQHIPRFFGLGCLSLIAHHFDALVDNAVARICSLQIQTEQQRKEIATLRSLPTFLGGLGIPRHSWVPGQKGAWLVQERWDRFLEEHYPTFQGPVKPNIIIGAQDPLEYLPAFDPATEVPPTPSEDQSPKEPTLAEKTSLIYQFTSDALLKSLEPRSRAKAAWFRSNRFQGSGRWLMTAGDKHQDPKYIFQDDEFRVALRWRLLESPFADLPARPDGSLYLCHGCNHEVHPEEPFHFLNCSRTGYQNERHAVGLRVLMEFLRERIPTVEIQTTPAYHDADGQLLNQFADLAVAAPLRDSKFVDLCVANPASYTFYTLPTPSHLTDLAAASYWEKKKLRDAARTDEVTKGLLVPFAVEATGRLGHAAVNYVHDMTFYNAAQQKRGIPPPSDILQSKMATALMRAQAHHACQFYHRLRGTVPVPEDTSEF